MLQEFSQQVEETARAVLDELHTAIPGEIISFNPKTCSALVKPIGMHTTHDGKRIPYPQMSNIPVVFPFCISANAGISYPVLSGDNCLIVISESELDEWRSGSESPGPMKFDLSNAVCIPGLLSHGSKAVLKACGSNAVVVCSGNTELIVSSESVNIEVGNVALTVSDTGITARGDLKVMGDIISAQSIKAGNIDLGEHTHKSAIPGENTGKPE